MTDTLRAVESVVNGFVFSKPPIKILHVEDSITDAELISRELKRAGLIIEIRRVESRERYLAELDDFVPHLILSDFSLPQFDGLSALTIAHEKYPETPFLFVSGTIAEDTAIAALRGGAVDYVLKTNIKRLPSAIQRSLLDSRMRIERIQADSRFRDLIEYAPNAIIVINEGSVIEIVNARTENLFGYAREEIVGKSYRMLGDNSKNFVPQYIESFYQKFRSEASTEAMKTPFPPFKSIGKRKDGGEFPAEVFMSPMLVGDALWICGSIIDITERVKQEDALSRLLRIQTVLSNINAAGIRLRDQTALCNEVCDIVVEHGQFQMAWIGMIEESCSVGQIIASAGMVDGYIEHVRITRSTVDEGGMRPPSVALREKRIMICNDILAEPSMAQVHDVARQNGLLSMVALPLITNGTATGVLVIYAKHVNYFSRDEMALLTQMSADVSFALEHQLNQARLNFLAYHDRLTELPNRLQFLEKLQELLILEGTEREKGIALILVDVNRFRNINDTLGREAGDAVLQEIKARLQRCPSTSRFIARIDSNCFAFIVGSAVTNAELIDVIEPRMARRMARSMQIGGKELHVSYRAGTALFPGHGTDATTLLRNAEAALGDAKSSKLPHQVYNPEMNARMAEKLSLETRLKRAVEQQLFLLHYQPKFDLKTGVISGIEALIRWNDPEHGLIPPFQFIQAMEETGLITDVGTWVIREAYRQHKEWTASGITVPKIAVNVSQLQIRQKDFVETVLAILGDDGAKMLEIEITESLFAEDLAENVAKLAAVRSAGIPIAIDDFGTGYSSLSYIARLPVDTLKIDRSFITDMVTNANQMAIVSTIISLAHGLNLNVVAEGVETEEQANLLRQLSCDQVQGFLYSRPLPAERIAELMRQMLTLEKSAG
jgi:diguanylate cyclase (GGDEF)-like protein/PAS domain S-box-containing protein